MELKDLLDIYAEYWDRDRDIVEGDFYIGIIGARDLLGAYLRNEGIYGYDQTLMEIFKVLKELEK